jgi:hypothetical protein
VRAQTVCGESWQDSSGRAAEHASLLARLGVPVKPVALGCSRVGVGKA